MSVRDIRLFGDPVLRTVVRSSRRHRAGVEALVADLLDTVQVPGRAGVAANQIGVALRAFSYNVDGGSATCSTRSWSRCAASPSVRRGLPVGAGPLFPTRRYPWARTTGSAARRRRR